jgi:hypothetical protein
MSLRQPYRVPACASRLRLAALLTLLLVVGPTGGCAVPVAVTCPSCLRLDVAQPLQLPPQTREVFLLVPGLLGYGWEWNEVQVALAQRPQAAVLVYDWDPWVSVMVASERLQQHLKHLLKRRPASVQRLVVIGHSAAGLLVLQAASRLVVPAGLAVEVLSVGAPLAGNNYNIYAGADNLRSPLPMALSGTFTRWPEPAPGVKLSVYATGPSDPVMKPRFGHDPGDPRALPKAARLFRLPHTLDHNLALAVVVRSLLQPATSVGTPGAAAARPAAPADSLP